ncbi:MAG: monovalent cation/H+ antiporter subunit A [Gammaproteobacteria bacterium]|jgi:multicomponent K+:H+ antiporter subunit A|nr:monovalent cation/H+ antiporter subunit A [Gammaproteobacteria bacterium]
MELLLIILLPFLGAGLTALCARLGRNAPAWAAGIVTAASALCFASLVPQVFDGDAIRVAWPWIPELGLNFSLRLDGLGFLFVTLILGIGMLVVMYARYYLAPTEALGRFFSLLLLFMGSMLGVVTADNLIVLVIFWELTSLSSFLLIGFWRHRADARQGARMALAVTGGGGLSLLAGVLLLGHIAGSYEISDVIARGDLIRAHDWYVPTLVLILIGAFAKSAQFPLHFWLPHAMSAPTPVSAYLHSATMVKAGVFLIARLYPALSGTDLWFFLVGGVGMATLIFGAYVSLFQHDIKGLLAYSTISHLGLITLLFGMGTELSAIAAVFHIINHAIFKASLFMAAGIIDHETGTRDMRRINGLWRFMPHTATLAMVAAASMAGVPLFNGFLSKEMFFAESLSEQLPLGVTWLVPTLAVIAGVFAVAYSLRFIHDVFFNGDPIDLPRTPHEPPRFMKIPVEILVALCLLVGILPGITVQPILEVITASVLQTPAPHYEVVIWHGFTLPFMMSLVALAGGATIYVYRRRLFAFYERIDHLADAKRMFEATLAMAIRGAARITRIFESGSQQRYLLILIGVSLIAGIAAYLDAGIAAVPAQEANNLDPIAIVTFVILAAAALAGTIWHRQRILAVILFGAVGLVVTLTFARFSAPDLALTQLSVEVVSVILLLLALHFLPDRSPAESSAGRRWRDATLSVAAGGGMGLLTWEMLRRPHDSISDYFLENAQTGGGGTNVVNVILVDFRGFDTWGEISVLGIAAVAIFAILRNLVLAPPRSGIDGRPWAANTHPLFLRMISRPLLPLALLVSFYILLRGHNLPGGGFIAALITAVALILQYIAGGISWASERSVRDYHPVIAAGLLVATGTGVGAWAFGAPFLTSTFGHPHLPLIGEIELASAMLFDLGVYLAVVGAVMLILIQLGEPSGNDSATSPQTVAGNPIGGEGE